MTIPQLIFVDGSNAALTTVESSATVTATFNASTNEIILEPVSGQQVGQQIFSKFYTLGSDFLPSIIVPSTGTKSTYALQTSAIFWTISYTPQSTNSTIYLYSCINTNFTMSSSSTVGIATFCYPNSTAGTLPLAMAGGYYFPPLSAAPICYGQCMGQSPYTNSSTSPISFTLAAYLVGASSGQRIFGSNSTATQFNGYTPSTAKIVEVLS